MYTAGWKQSISNSKPRPDSKIIITSLVSTDTNLYDRQMYSIKTQLYFTYKTSYTFCLIMAAMIRLITKI